MPNQRRPRGPAEQKPRGISGPGTLSHFKGGGSSVGQITCRGTSHKSAGCGVTQTNAGGEEAGQGRARARQQPAGPSCSSPSHGGPPKCGRVSPGRPWHGPRSYNGTATPPIRAAPGLRPVLPHTRPRFCSGLSPLLPASLALDQMGSEAATCCHSKHRPVSPPSPQIVSPGGGVCTGRGRGVF